MIIYNFKKIYMIMKKITSNNYILVRHIKTNTDNKYLTTSSLLILMLPRMNVVPQTIWVL